MPLLGRAAMLLAFDVAPEAVAEHDHWHTFEHLPERLSIPGFLRGTRWVAVAGEPRYFVLYEVAGLDVLTSAAYLERLNQPSAWTTTLMPHYRGMRRGFCTVSASVGAGLGGAATLLRFRPADGAADALRRWLVDEVLPAVPGTPGLAGAHLLEGAATPAMTREQRIRGADGAVDWAIVVTGGEPAALDALAIDAAALGAHGALEVQQSTYRLHGTLSRGEVAS